MRIVVLISADAEWNASLDVLQPLALERTPYGACFTTDVAGEPVVVAQGGWGKVAAAASTEYAIGRWDPAVVINLGTCGGIDGRVRRGEKILATNTVIYDIHEAMGDPAAAVQAYSTTIDLAWLGPALPVSVTPAPLYSADADLVPERLAALMVRAGAVAADWESGAIAFVASRRQRRLVILRAVSDLVSPSAGEVVDNVDLFRRRASEAMATLLADLRTLVPFIVRRLEMRVEPSERSQTGT